MMLHITPDSGDDAALVAIARARSARIEEVLRASIARRPPPHSLGVLSIDEDCPGFEELMSYMEKQARGVEPVRDARTRGHCTFPAPRDLIARVLDGADGGRIAAWVRELSADTLPFVHLHGRGVSYYTARLDPPARSTAN